MTEHQIKKPTLFISHASSDGEFANAVKQEVEKVFANGIAVCAPEIELANLPSPLDRLQALSMGKAADLKLLFDALIAQFGFGKISAFRASNISSRIPKYKDVRIVETDLTEKIFYSGRYSGYGDVELCEVIDTLLFAPDEEKRSTFSMNYREREELIHNGKLIHFRDVDRKLDLPPDTAKRLLNTVAARYGLEPELELDNLVRYARADQPTQIIRSNGPAFGRPNGSPISISTRGHRPCSSTNVLPCSTPRWPSPLHA